MRERRLYPRVERDFPVDIRLFDVPPTSTTYKLPLVQARTRDISMSGLQIVTPVEMPVGHRMHLRVVVDDPPSSYMHTARVRWVRPHEPKAFTAGVEFVMETTNSKRDWSELVEQVIRESHGSSFMPTPPAP